MLKKIKAGRFIPVLFLCSFLCSGCIYVVAGSIGAVGGYIASPDTVEGILNKDEESVWDAALDIVGIMGIVQEKFEHEGIIIAKISGAKVTVKIIRISESTQKISIKARKGFFPRIKVAQDVYVKIAASLNE